MLKPTKNRVLVEPINQIKEMEKGGILLPSYAENIMPDKGTVIAVGPEVKEVKVGDKIIFDRIRADNLKDRQGLIDKKYLIFPETLIMVKYE